MPRCSAKTASGRRCKNSCLVTDGAVYCTNHSQLPPPEPKPIQLTPLPPSLPLSCSHSCDLHTDACCACSDRRPHSQALYIKYVDGFGDLPLGRREDGYCSKCKFANPSQPDYEHIVFALSSYRLENITDRRSLQAFDKIVADVKAKLENQRGKISIYMDMLRVLDRFSGQCNIAVSLTKHSDLLPSIPLPRKAASKEEFTSQAKMLFETKDEHPECEPFLARAIMEYVYNNTDYVKQLPELKAIVLKRCEEGLDNSPLQERLITCCKGILEVLNE